MHRQQARHPGRWTAAFLAVAWMVGAGALVTPSLASEPEAPEAEAGLPTLETERALAGVAQQAGMPAFDASDPAAMAALLTQHGYQAQLDPRSDTSVWVRTQVQGQATRVSVFIRMLGCTEGKSCQHIVLSTGLRPSGDPDPELIQSFNRQRAMGAAYIGDGGVYWVRYYMSVLFLRDAGQMLELVRLWRGEVVDFARHVGVEI